MNMTTTVKTSVAVLVVALAGCATQKDLDATHAIAERAVKDAAVAKNAADAAMDAAQRAATAATAAQGTANQALQGAAAGQACCDATNEKMLRMFEKSVRK